MQSHIRKTNYTNKSSTRDAQRHVTHCAIKELSKMVGMGLCSVNSGRGEIHGMYPTLETK